MLQAHTGIRTRRRSIPSSPGGRNRPPLRHSPDGRHPRRRLPARASVPPLPSSCHGGMVVSGRPEDAMTPDHLVRLLQMTGAALAIPAAAAGTFAAYPSYFSTDVTCQKLRSNIVAIMERHVAPETK